MKILLIALMLLTGTAYAADTVLVDRDSVTTPIVLGTAALKNTGTNAGEVAAADDPRLSDARTPTAHNQAWSTITGTPTTLSGYGITDALKPGDVATYIIAPYGATYTANYYCSATDCGPVFQTVFDAIKVSGKGGEIKLREGIYPFATGVDAADADSVKIGGVGGVGMWANGGTILKRTANITMFDFSASTKNPRACQVEGIHFQDASMGYTAPLLKYHDAHNMAQKGNYFDVIPQAIYADRAWDFWTVENNFRNCGTGATAATACITAYDGDIDQASGWKLIANRWESRPGTSFYSDSSGLGGTNNNISFVDNKFEGVNGGNAYPAIAGTVTISRLIGNYIYGADTGYSPIDLSGDNNTIIGNHVQGHKEPAIKLSGGYSNVQSNMFRSAGANLSGHVQIVSGSSNRIANNNKYDPSYPTIPMVLDGGTATVQYRNTGAENNAIANLTDWPAGLDSTELGYLNGVTSNVQTQISAKEPSLGNPGTDGFVLSSTAAGVRSWVAQTSGGGGSMTWPTVAGIPYWTSGTAWAGAYTVGAGANNLVQLDSNSKLPAVDGSALTRIGVAATDTNTSIGLNTPVNPSGGSDTSVGRNAGNALTSGAENSFFGNRAGARVTSGSYNNAYGSFALYENRTGNNNLAIGKGALTLFNPSDTSGNNVGIGSNAGGAITTGTNNTFVGHEAGYTGTTATVTNSTAIGHKATVTASNTIQLGDANVVEVKTAGRVTAKLFVPAIPAAATDGATVTFDLSAGDSPSVTLGGNRTLAVSNATAGQWWRLNLIQDATGGRTVTWFSGISWRNTPSNAAPTLLTGANKTDTFVCHNLTTSTFECWTAGNQ